MKLPPSVRRMTRKALGMGSAVAIAPAELRELAARGGAEDYVAVCTMPTAAGR